MNQNLAGANFNHTQNI